MKRLFARFLLVLAIAALPLVSLETVDAIGIGHSAGWEDLIGLLVNLVCLGVVVVLVVIVIVTAVIRKLNWRFAVAVLLIPIAAIQAYPYLSAYESSANASLDPGPAADYRFSEMPTPWPYPDHESRQVYTRDLDSDGTQETVIVDSYVVNGSSADIVEAVAVYRVDGAEYQTVFSQAVDEGRYYSHYGGCPDKGSLWFGGHSAIRLINMDADSQVELFAHQAAETNPPDCRYDYYYDWNGAYIRPVIPNPGWLAERGIYFFVLPAILMASSLVSKRRALWAFAGVSTAYLIWAGFEAVLSVDFLLWGVLGSGMTIDLIVRARRSSRSS